jgi:hypothetical protein
VAAILILVAIAFLMMAGGGVLGLRGGLFSDFTIRLLGRLDAQFTEPDPAGDEFTGNYDLTPLPVPGEPSAERALVRLRLVDVEISRAEAWKKTAASREKVLRKVNDTLVVSFTFLVWGGVAYVISQA